MRNVFHEQLEQLNVELIRMGALCEEAISAATKALLDKDLELGRKAEELEQEIDQKERDIENQCMKLLLRQQPVASDLRAVSAALRMISDMERIGDQASDIAEIARGMEEHHLRRKVPMAEMARAAIGMVTDTQIIARQADMSIYVCRADYTLKSDFEMVNSLSTEKKLPNMCILLNDLDMDKRKNGYYYGYGKYGKYGKYGYGKKYGYGYGYGYGKDKKNG